MVDFEDKYDRDGMDILERQLRNALRPLPAPEGFAGRVLARAKGSQKAESIAFRTQNTRPQMRWVVAAVLLLAISAGAFWVHQRQRRIAGERVRDQVLLALRITSHTIRDVRDQVNRDSDNNSQPQETP